MIKVLKIRLAKITKEICEKLYDKGPSYVYDYANKIKLPYHTCVPCEASTPTISDSKSNICALCGTNKTIIQVHVVGYEGNDDLATSGWEWRFDKKWLMLNIVNIKKW
jgi:hypothetical protein